MNGHILLIGGGEITKGETKTIDDKIKALVPAHSKLVFFPTSAGDSEGYIKTIESVFGDVFEVTAVTETKGSENAIQELQSAQIVYLGGGRTELLLDLVHRWNLTAALKGVLERGGVMAGISAGAQALSFAYADFSETEPMEVKKGWGFCNVFCLVHAKNEQIPKTFDVYKNGDLKDTPFVGIGEQAAWYIHDESAEKVGDGPIWLSTGQSIDNGVLSLFPKKALSGHNLLI